MLAVQDYVDRDYQIQIVILQAIGVWLRGVDRHLCAVYPLWNVLYAILNNFGVPAGLRGLNTVLQVLHR